MSSHSTALVAITEQIDQQVGLLRQDQGALSDLQTMRARLEAILQFASQGIHLIEERQHGPARQRPNSSSHPTVK